ncbi:uncharacterized protein LOC115243278 [Formica exsecta]|uniref:uncharacterized protein LOC115243278 n=1 Tax=Formica exsecta TaxID=72781 RepID=UPI001144BC03|nr:uncharacterized protein LOC115243278 [Formica exsecta]
MHTYMDQLIFLQICLDIPLRQKTCRFDAIIHILKFGALYDSLYHFSIQNNHALKFVSKFMKMCSTMEILRERIVLLDEFYPIVKDPEAPSIKPHKLIAEDSITAIWKYLFCCSKPTEPCAIRSFECIQALQDTVLFNEHYYNVKCRQKNCPGTVIETIRSHFHIFINLDARTHRKKTHGFKCQLTGVPVTLNFGKQYRLIGVIEYIPGHFIGYCRKPSER